MPGKTYAAPLLCQTICKEWLCMTGVAQAEIIVKYEWGNQAIFW